MYRMRAGDAAGALGLGAEGPVGAGVPVGTGVSVGTGVPVGVDGSAGSDEKPVSEIATAASARQEMAREVNERKRGDGKLDLWLHRSGESTWTCSGGQSVRPTGSYHYI